VRDKVVIAVIALACLVAACLLLVTQADGRSRPPVPPRVFKAVRAEWRSTPNRVEAFDLIWCESRYDVDAENGQYLGLFQMGDWARARYGHGSTARAQARSAHRLWLDFGWSRSQWSCA